ncbi:uncharacterized protein PgNI_11958 [Pyricularia grisea]|uniref:Uncharacterized protein n=1 Tax=Pyricularia grisea TaxID=148305 RepID=A0A6P8AQP8_PYRGI|nr:uncharacterized protein PgNI_11958 [Pyricularia grisea]TLD04374.1 hypothetical protein PgNI_11958 [Pyricularia grisea]
MTSFLPTNSDTAWQREKTTIIQAITKAAPSTVLLDVLCVPLEVVGAAVSRTVVVCTKTRIDNATRVAIRTRIAALNPCEDRFDVVYRTGEITRVYAEVIGARREWIEAVWGESPIEEVQDVAAVVDQGSVEGGKVEGGQGVEAKETLSMLDDLVKAEVAKALQEIEAEAAAHQVDDEVFQAIGQIEAEVEAERLPRVRSATELSKPCMSTPEMPSPAVRGDAGKEQVVSDVSRPCAAKKLATRPSGLQPPKTISVIPSRLQAPTKPASPRGLPRPHARSQSLSVCRLQSLPAASKAQDQLQQLQSKTLPSAQGTSRLQAPRKTASLSAPVRAPAQSKLEPPQAKGRIVRSKAKTEPPACKSATPRATSKVLAPPQIRGLPRPAAGVSLGVSGPSSRIGMLPRAVPRPTRG